jgi:hypothetical protein
VQDLWRELFEVDDGHPRRRRFCATVLTPLVRAILLSSAEMASWAVAMGPGGQVM